MCYCNPSLRTPCCGGVDCYPTSSTISNNTKPNHQTTKEVILEQSSLALWQSYCAKKMECEMLREKLAETLDMLEYAHTTSEAYYDYEKVSGFIGEMYKLLGNLK